MLEVRGEPWGMRFIVSLAPSAGGKGLLAAKAFEVPVVYRRVEIARLHGLRAPARIPHLAGVDNICSAHVAYVCWIS